MNKKIVATVLAVLIVVVSAAAAWVNVTKDSGDDPVDIVGPWRPVSGFMPSYNGHYPDINKNQISSELRTEPVPGDYILFNVKHIKGDVEEQHFELIQVVSVFDGTVDYRSTWYFNGEYRMEMQTASSEEFISILTSAQVVGDVTPTYEGEAVTRTFAGEVSCDLYTFDIKGETEECVGQYYVYKDSGIVLRQVFSNTGGDVMTCDIRLKSTSLFMQGSDVPAIQNLPQMHAMYTNSYNVSDDFLDSARKTPVAGDFITLAKFTTMVSDGVMTAFNNLLTTTVVTGVDGDALNVTLFNNTALPILSESMDGSRFMEMAMIFNHPDDLQGSGFSLEGAMVIDTYYGKLVCDVYCRTICSEGVTETEWLYIDPDTHLRYKSVSNIEYVDVDGHEVVLTSESYLFATSLVYADTWTPKD